MNSHSVPEDYLSPVDLVAGKDGKTIYVAEYTGRSVAALDVESGKVTKRIELPGRPSNVRPGPNGDFLYVSCAEPQGTVEVIDLAAGKIVRSIKVGHTPMSPIVSPDGKTLYVCNRFNDDISVVDLLSGAEKQRIKVTREPVASVMTSDGSLVFVANHLPTGAANVDYMTSVIDVIDTATAKVIKSINLPNGAIDLRGICISPDGKTVYVPSILARFMVPTTQIERGWINTHALNVIDVAQEKLLYTVLLDDIAQGAANPWGVTCSPDNKYIYVAHSATHEISVIDREAFMVKLANVTVQSGTEKTDQYQPQLSSAYNPVNDLSFLSGIRTRHKVKGNGPRGVVAVGNKVYFAEYFTDSIGVLTVGTNSNCDVLTMALGSTREMDQVRLGEMYFNDASLCFQQWQSCGTCHPDGRADAVNWDLLNDGLGNPKNTKSLLYSVQTPPVMITGVRDKAETAVRTGIRYIQFIMPDETKAQAIDAYIKDLKPVPSPHLVDGKLSEKARQGQKIFEQSGCSSCHSGVYYTDMQKYNVGTADGMEDGREFDTPTLVEIWRTAPYLYDGRAPTIKDVLTRFNRSNMHGMTSGLSDADMDRLMEYLLSL